MNRIVSFLIVCFCLSSCASRLTTIPETSNTLKVDLMDPAVSYSRIEGTMDAFSAFGMYTGGDRDPQYVADVVVLQGNGWWLGTGRGFGLLSGLSFVGTAIGTSRALRQFENDIFGQETPGVRLLSSILIAGTINESLWRSFNVRRAHSEALMEVVKNASEADFYTNPRVETTMKTRLLSTKYQVKSRMLSGSFPENFIERDRFLNKRD